MISVSVEKEDGAFRQVTCLGHAGFDVAGKDIVCGAVSILVINTINAIERFTEDAITVESDEKKGLIILTFTETVSKEASLLLDAMLLGIKETERAYGKRYVSLTIRED